MMSCRAFGIIGRFVNELEMVCGTAMVFGLMCFCRFRAVWKAVS